MLGKLLKYDLKAIYKPLSIFYGIVIVSMFLSHYFDAIDTNGFTFFCREFFRGTTVGFSLGAIINNAMNIWAYFRQNLYGDRGYLMNTLPVSRNTLLLSKFLTALITSLTIVIIGVIAIVLAYGAALNLPDFINNSLALTFQIILVFYLEIVFVMQCGISGVIIGHKFNYNKIALSVVFGFGIFVIANVLTIVLAFIWSCFDSNLSWLFDSSTIIPDLNIMQNLLTAGAIVYAVYIAGLYTLNAHLLKRGIDLD